MRILEKKFVQLTSAIAEKELISQNKTGAPSRPHKACSHWLLISGSDILSTASLGQSYTQGIRQIHKYNYDIINIILIVVFTDTDFFYNTQSTTSVVVWEVRRNLF